MAVQVEGGMWGVKCAPHPLFSLLASPLLLLELLRRLSAVTQAQLHGGSRSLHRRGGGRLMKWRGIHWPPIAISIHRGTISTQDIQATAMHVTV